MNNAKVIPIPLRYFGHRRYVDVFSISSAIHRALFGGPPGLQIRNLDLRISKPIRHDGLLVRAPNPQEKHDAFVHYSFNDETNNLQEYAVLASDELISRSEPELERPSVSEILFDARKATLLIDREIEHGDVGYMGMVLGKEILERELPNCSPRVLRVRYNEGRSLRIGDTASVEINRLLLDFFRLDYKINGAGFATITGKYLGSAP